MVCAHAQQDERHAFGIWLAAHPQHAREYEAFEKLWQDFDSTVGTRALAAAAQAERAHGQRRRMGKGLLGMAGLSSLGWLLLQGWQSHLDAPQLTLARSTHPGQRLRLPLPDGSVILLGGASRPFLVNCGQARVTVVGTCFAVERLPGSVRVSVEEGIVGFAAQSTPDATLTLQAGEVGAWPRQRTAASEGGLRHERASASFDNFTPLPQLTATAPQQIQGGTTSYGA